MFDRFNPGRRQDTSDGNTDATRRGSLAEAVAQARGVHGYDADPAAEVEHAGLPSVNRRKGGSQLVTVLGFIFILGAAAAMIVAVNSDKERAGSTRRETPERIANNLPPLAMPAAVSTAFSAPPPPPVLAPAREVPVKPIPLRQESAGSGRVKDQLDWHERKMGGNLLVEHKPNFSTSAARVGGIGPSDTGVAATGASLLGRDSAGRTALGGLLEPTATPRVAASMLPNRNFLITKGTTLDCALETALDSTLPGITTCRLTRDVYSDNGQVLLLDRGTQLVGEYQGGMKQGQARLFVLWTRAKTPHGVVVSLNSPGTDALGRSGLEGWVDTHFAERFGAAILFTFIQDSIRVGLAQQSDSADTVVIGNTVNSGEKVVEKILDSTVNIPPTLVKNHGDHVQVMVARDLDFSSVYALQVQP